MGADLNKETENKKRARRVVLVTGLLPTSTAWIWYLVSLRREDKDIGDLMIWFVTSTILLTLFSWPFRRLCFDWIYHRRPVAGSLASIAYHMWAGYFSVMLPLILNPLAKGNLIPAGWGLGVLIYGVLVFLPQLPGALLGFYLCAHMMVKLSKGKWVLSVD